jgi:peptidyl-Lys metalloendopeptidase
MHFGLLIDASTYAGPASIKDVENLKVTATITNTGSETLKILDDPRSLISTRPVNKFSITDAKGTRPSFTGIKVKYSPEAAAAAGAYTVLAPGASLSITHNCTWSNQLSVILIFNINATYAYSV